MNFSLKIFEFWLISFIDTYYILIIELFVILSLSLEVKLLRNKNCKTFFPKRTMKK